MLIAFDTKESVFDRTDLRVLRSAYAQALKTLQVEQVVDDEAKTDLAKLVVSVGRGRLRSGLGLRGDVAHEAVACEVSDYLRKLRSFALCA